jgi:tRNA (guanine37-N1)-methyltransferase
MPFAVEVITLVPDMWPAMLGPHTGLTGRAFAEGVAELRVSDVRAYGKGPHRQVDDAPFGGGAGMVLQVEPLHRAITDARARTPGPVVLLTPRGQRFGQTTARRLSQGAGMTLVCGRYEGFDERVRRYVDLELSLGDFVLTAGDPAALSVIDATVRLLPGVLGNPDSLSEESHSGVGLEYPQYTRPAEYDGEAVPAVLRSGDHAAVAAWRRATARAITVTHRPDLLQEATKSA